MRRVAWELSTGQRRDVDCSATKPREDRQETSAQLPSGSTRKTHCAKRTSPHATLLLHHCFSPSPKTALLAALPLAVGLRSGRRRRPKISQGESRSISLDKPCRSTSLHLFARACVSTPKSTSRRGSFKSAGPKSEGGKSPQKK